MKVDLCDQCLTEDKVTPTRTRITLKHGGLRVALHACNPHAQALKKASPTIEVMAKIGKAAEEKYLFIIGQTFIKQP